MTFSSPPQREVTPEERQRAGRFFWLVLLVFLAFVAAMAVYLSLKSRAVRDYGQAVAQAVRTRTEPFQGRLDCAALVSLKAPSNVTSCTVARQSGGQVAVSLKLSSGQTYLFSAGQP